MYGELTGGSHRKQTALIQRRRLCGWRGFDKGDIEVEVREGAYVTFISNAI